VGNERKVAPLWKMVNGVMLNDNTSHQITLFHLYLIDCLGRLELPQEI